MAIIRVSRGDNLDIVYTIVDENEVIVDLTSGSVAWEARKSGTDVAVITKAGVLTDPSNGITTVSLEPADTTSLGGTYALYGTFTDSGANVYTFEDGALIVETDDQD